MFSLKNYKQISMSVTGNNHARAHYTRKLWQFFFKFWSSRWVYISSNFHRGNDHFENRFELWITCEMDATRRLTIPCRIVNGIYSLCIGKYQKKESEPANQIRKLDVYLCLFFLCRLLGVLFYCQKERVFESFVIKSKSHLFSTKEGTYMHVHDYNQNTARNTCSNVACTL